MQDASSIPGPGGSHMLQGNEASTPQLLSLGSGAHEPQRLGPQAANMEAWVPRAHAPQQENPPQLKGGPQPPQLEKVCTQQWRLSMAKNK